MKPLRMFPVLTPAQLSATTQNPGKMMNIAAITKFNNMSPKALFNPINGLKLLCGESQP